MNEPVFTDLPDKPDDLPEERKRFCARDILPRSLFGRSLLILIVPIFLIQLVTATVFFDNHWHKIMQRLAHSVSGEVAMIVRAVEEERLEPETDQVINDAAQYLDLYIQYEPEIRALKSSDTGANGIWESLVLSVLRTELDKSLDHDFFIHADFHKKWIEIEIALKDGMLLVVLPERRLFSSSGYIFLIWVFSTSFIVLVVAVIFMRNQIRPIRKLAVAAEWFGRGRDISNFKVSGAREVRQASQAFLDMRRRIQRQISQRTLMLAGVSHDLRTPLTRLRLQLSMMDECDDVSAMKADLKDMEDMIAGYLDFVKGAGDEEASTLRLSGLVNKIVDSPQLREKKLNIDIAPDMFVLAKPLALERCLGNLIYNAAYYAQSIWVCTSVTNDERIKICIEDDGPGIPEDQYEEVFKPFYRLDESRNAVTGGVGLGMPIAMDIVHAHGGKIWLEKSQYGGLKVVIRLPL